MRSILRNLFSARVCLTEETLAVQVEQLTDIDRLQPWDHAQKMRFDVRRLDFAVWPRGSLIMHIRIIIYIW